MVGTSTAKKNGYVMFQNAGAADFYALYPGRLHRQERAIPTASACSAPDSSWP